MKNKILPLILAILIIGSTSVLFSDISNANQDPYGESNVLLDWGNGDTQWLVGTQGTSVSNTASLTLNKTGYTYSVNGENTIINDIGNTTVGELVGTGTFSESGTTGKVVHSFWHVFKWNENLREWVAVAWSDSYVLGYLAIAFYPEGILPVETPEYKSSWTAWGADSGNTYNQTAFVSDEEPSVNWSFKPKMSKEATACYGAILFARGHAIVKWGYGDSTHNIAVSSYDVASGDIEWTFKYYANSYETASPLIGGQYIYLQSSSGAIYYFEWETGPGLDNENVKSFNGEMFDTTTRLPSTTIIVNGNAWGTGPTNMVFDSGCIFTKHSNGMVYCFNTNLELIWSYQTNGNTYFTPPTIHKNFVAAGMYDGHLYIIDKLKGTLIADEIVFQSEVNHKLVGQINVPSFMDNEDGCTLFVTYSNGGMSADTYGYSIFRFDGGNLTLVGKYIDTVGSVCNALTKWGDKGVILTAKTGAYKVYTDGTIDLFSETISNLELTHSAPTLVNSELLFFTSYSSHKLYEISIDGETLGVIDAPVIEHCMSPAVVVDGYILSGNDAGAYCFKGGFHPYIPPSEPKEKTENWQYMAYAIAALVAILSAIWAILKFGLKWDKPFLNLKSNLYKFMYGAEYTHNTRSKHKLWLVMIIGIGITMALALMSLCVGSETTLSPHEALSSMVSAIQKGGKHLNYEEMLIYNSRLPRTLATIAVGIGLSVAGAVYQAIIKNPLVEPYIMGVSSGAGTLAVAVISFDFTFFGLFSADDPFLTAIAAIFGGLLAFGLTMLLAVKTGGKSTNFVLAGIIIGLVFSAIQSLMMIQAGKDMASALSWLYGSFASMNWDKLWLVFVPAITISFVPLVWAKELNLVLLGDEQAKLMGLDVDKFNKLMLIIVSILTAFCVAFCGIIGFVGLVIPHLCRMILGGDHRLMLPASMAFGGFLMIAADLLARTMLAGYELPVGAITTIIGVPVFAYLLIKRGRHYDV